MVKYDFIKKLEREGILKTALNMGVVSCTINAHKIIYEMYLKNKQSIKSKILCYQLTAEDCKVSKETVKRVVTDFSRSI